MRTPKIRNKARCFLLTTPLTIILDIPASAIEQSNEIKDVQIRKEELKLSLLADGMIAIEHPRKSTKTKHKLLEFLSEFSKVLGFKINVENPIIFLDASNGRGDTRIKNTVSFTVVERKGKEERKKEKKRKRGRQEEERKGQ